MTPWILRPRDRTEGVEWTLAVSHALDNPDGEKVPDQIWWETNDVAAAAFLLIAGYARFGALDWPVRAVCGSTATWRTLSTR